jgi:sulfite exporter TauE/SafE
VVIIFRVDLSVLFNIFTIHSKAIRICTSICFGIALIALGLSTCSTSEVSKTYKKYNKLVKTKKNLAPDPKFNWWVLYFFTFFYVAVEFGFNYQMLDLTVDFASEDILLGLEFWGRVISGVGLSLVLYRLSSGMNIFNGFRYVLCLIMGISLMWNLQKMLTDYLVEQANLEDKKISFLLAVLGSKAADGSLATLSGNPIVTLPLAEQDRKITASLFPAIALYAPNRNEQIAVWNGASPAQIQLLLATDYSDAQLANAYRNLIIPPLTLGISIFFALINLAQWAGMTLSILEKRWGISPSIIRVFTTLIFIALLLFSSLAASPFADSRAYQEELKKPLYENDYFLGILATVSAHAVPNWYFLSKACNQYVLGGVQLKRPY